MVSEGERKSENGGDGYIGISGNYRSGESSRFAGAVVDGKFSLIHMSAEGSMRQWLRAGPEELAGYRSYQPDQSGRETWSADSLYAFSAMSSRSASPVTVSPGRNYVLGNSDPGPADSWIPRRRTLHILRIAP